MKLRIPAKFLTHGAILLNLAASITIFQVLDCCKPIPKVQATLPPLYPTATPTAKELLAIGNPYSLDEFLRTIHTVYISPDDSRTHFFPTFKGLYFYPDNSPTPLFLPWEFYPSPPFWRKLSDLPPITNPAQPLANVRIAIDPGHIGGTYASQEERHSKDSKGRYFAEGDATLTTALILKKQLEKLGANVYLTRNSATPASNLDFQDFRKRFALYYPDLKDDKLDPIANREYVRIAEIHARAIALKKFQPDLTICLHFDASKSSRVNRLHGLLHGAYLPEEIADPPTRSQLCEKLLSKHHTDELRLNSKVIANLARDLKLPPLSYSKNAAWPVGSEPYLWRRNLLANRLYPGPVIFLEPFNMNNKVTAQRLAEGDYSGTRKFFGQAYPSIFQQYASAISEALALDAFEQREIRLMEPIGKNDAPPPPSNPPDIESTPPAGDQ